MQGSRRTQVKGFMKRASVKFPSVNDHFCRRATIAIDNRDRIHRSQAAAVPVSFFFQAAFRPRLIAAAETAPDVFRKYTAHIAAVLIYNHRVDDIGKFFFVQPWMGTSARDTGACLIPALIKPRAAGNLLVRVARPSLASSLGIPESRRRIAVI